MNRPETIRTTSDSLNRRSSDRAWHAQIGERYAEDGGGGEACAFEGQVRQGVDRHGADQERRGFQALRHVVAQEEPAECEGGADAQCRGEGEGHA